MRLDKRRTFCPRPFSSKPSTPLTEYSRSLNQELSAVATSSTSSMPSDRTGPPRRHRGCAGPTINLTVVFIMLSLCSKLGLRKKVFDVTGAFLNAELESPEYMRLSRQITRIITEHDPGKEHFVHHDGTMVVKLLRALYGLKTVSLSWYSLLASTLEAYGYMRSSMDSCLFTKTQGGGTSATSLCMWMTCWCARQARPWSQRWRAF